MAAAAKRAPTSVRAESLLRGLCAAMAAAAALLLGLSAQTKTVLFVRKKAVPKDVEALWCVRMLITLIEIPLRVLHCMFITRTHTSRIEYVSGC